MVRMRLILSSIVLLALVLYACPLGLACAGKAETGDGTDEENAELTSLVTTLPATDITDNSARLNGSVSTMLVGTTNVYFVVASGDTAGEFAWTDNQTMSAPGEFSAVISNLVPGTMYFFRAVHGSDRGIKGGTRSPDSDPADFTTNPDVWTLDATAISGTSATLNGNFPGVGTRLGVQAYTQGYFLWGAEPGSYVNETPRQTRLFPGTFSAEITGLSSGITYYFVSVALYPRGGVTLMGEEKSFYLP